MRCYLKILCIWYKDHVINKEVCAKVQQATGPQEDLRTIVKRCKLKWYGHVSRSSGLTKTVLQGTGGRQNKTRQAEKRGWKTTPGNGQAWGSQSPRGQRRTEKNGENWLWSPLWCLNDPSSYGICKGEAWRCAIYMPGKLWEHF